MPRLGLCLHEVGIPCLLPWGGEEARREKPVSTLRAALLRVHKWPTSRYHRRPGLCRLLSCACLDLLLGPDFLTLPSLLAHLLALHSLSFAGLSMGKRFWRKSPYRWAFPSFQGRCRLETCLLSFFRTPDAAHTPPFPLSACCPWAPGLCPSALPVPCLPLGAHIPATL